MDYSKLTAIEYSELPPHERAKVPIHEMIRMLEDTPELDKLSDEEKEKLREINAVKMKNNTRTFNGKHISELTTEEKLALL